MRAPEFWTQNDGSARFVTAALAPLGWLYGGITAWKRTHTQAYRAQARVVCVGNLTVGGTGKTPVVAAIARQLQARALRAMVLTRGYGGRVSEPSLVDRAVHRVGDVGDEALLLATELPVIVARNRRKGAQLADAHAADVVVMDDGHQNFHLVKDLSLVLVDAATGFGNGGIVPAGPLREFVRHGLARADAVILVGDGTPPLAGYGGPVLRAQIVPVDAASYARRRLVAFAGIGQPHRFFETLRKLDTELVDTIAFGDHHVFSAAEIARLKARAAGADALLVTTEKDYVRLTAAEREGISVLPVQAQFDRPELLHELLDRALRRAIA